MVERLAGLSVSSAPYGDAGLIRSILGSHFPVADIRLAALRTRGSYSTVSASRVTAVSASAYAKFMGISGTLATFDLETTGVDVETSRIVSACIAFVDPSGAVVSRWDWLADPGVEIPAGAAAIHGISTERARAEGRQAAIVVAEIVQTLKVTCALGMPLVVYNAPYDLSLLDRECRRHSINSLVEPYVVIDPLVIDKAVDRYRRGKRTLEVTAGLYGVSLDDAHDAGSDAIAAARVAHALVAKYTDELSIPFAELHDRQRQWYADQAASFQDYMRSSKGDHNFVANSEWPVRSFPQ
ncbi:DNA polymerase-3 subunit epsilon [Rhodoglobus vestalii]|uniref:DNA polymerase-3 subunit epsilon n=2 Tax=Rhodoglobus vestalii TaxID=193384 RepID=A0A8H2K3U4_9MICO|nr:DNA polymerase-3 subunit epsilon [Rhodoglobus vestalii]